MSSYTPAEIFRLLLAFLGPKPLHFHPDRLPDPFFSIFTAILEAYLKNPHHLPARHTAFAAAFETLTPQEIRTFDAYLEEGSIEHYAIRIQITPHQKNVIRALFNIAPDTVSQIAEYVGENLGNTYRRLKSLVKKDLVILTQRQGKKLYHLNHQRFLVENPFPDPFPPLDLHQFLAELNAETEAPSAQQP